MQGQQGGKGWLVVALFAVIMNLVDCKSAMDGILLL
jgi:hypothetical protein